MTRLFDVLTEFINETDWGLVVFSFVVGFLALAVLVTFIWNILIYRRERKYNHTLGMAHCVFEVLKLNYRENSCLRFYLSDIKEKKEGTFDLACAGLLPLQQELLKKWLKAIKEGKEVNPYLQSRCYLDESKKPIACFFRLVHHDPEKGLIHLEKILIREKLGKKSHRLTLSSTEELAMAIKANGYERGALLLFQLNTRRRERDSSGRIINQISSGLGSRFRDLLYPFATGNQKMVQYGDGQLAIANFDLLDRTQALDFALQVINTVNKSLPKKRNSEYSSFEITCGIVLFADLLGESTTILSMGARLADLAFNNKEVVMFFDRDKEGLNESDLASGKGDVARIISERKIEFLFQPIYDLIKRRILGYYCQFVPRGTPYNSIEELKSYANRVQQGKTLFSYLAKETVAIFENQRQYQYQCLFLPIMACELDCAIKVFSRAQFAKKVGLVLVFKESDLYSESAKSSGEALVTAIKKLKGYGLHIGLLAEGQSLLLDDSFHSLADYFFTDFSITEGGSAKVDMKIRSRLHALVEKLLRYKKPIVASQVGTWNTLELLYRSGLAYVSGTPIGGFEPMVKPIQDKVHKRINALIERK